jgi:hypothetical protein
MLPHLEGGRSVSDVSQDPGWWPASDRSWHQPGQHPAPPTFRGQAYPSNPHWCFTAQEVLNFQLTKGDAVQIQIVRTTRNPVLTLKGLDRR